MLQLNVFNQIFKLGLVLFLLDIIFISFMFKNFNDQILLVQGSSIKLNILGGILSYFFLTLGLYYFIIKENKSHFDAFILGLCIYGVYEYTTLALLKNWLLKTTIIDTIWGGTLFALSTYIIQRI